MESRADQLRRLFDQARARRAQRPSDMWGVYNIARGERAYWRTIERACADHLAGEQRLPDARGFFAAVQTQLQYAEHERESIATVVHEFEVELGLRAAG